MAPGLFLFFQNLCLYFKVLLRLKEINSLMWVGNLELCWAGGERGVSVYRQLWRKVSKVREQERGREAGQHVTLPSVWFAPSKFTAVPETLPKPTVELRPGAPDRFQRNLLVRDSVLSKDATSNEAEQNSWPIFPPSCRLQASVGSEEHRPGC